MREYDIAVVVGSLRKDSLNRKFADALARLAPTGLKLREVGLADLPLYNQDDDSDQPQAVRRFKAEIEKADAVIFVTPEYNRSIPGVLKNAIDHGSRPYGKSSWIGKPAGVVGVSPGAAGTAMAQQHLRNVLTSLDMPAMQQPEAFIVAREGLFDADGAIGEQSRAFVQKWLVKYADWVKAHVKA